MLAAFVKQNNFDYVFRQLVLAGILLQDLSCIIPKNAANAACVVTDVFLFGCLKAAHIMFFCVAFQHDLICFVEVVGDFDAALSKYALRAIFYMMRVHAGRDS
jgi:hypothetical protein